MTIPILIISHDGLAEALLRSAEMICGEQSDVAVLGLQEGDGLTNFMEKVKEQIQLLKNEAGLLVMVDLQGGTPWNATVGFCHPGVCILTGVNLPMLLEVLMCRDQKEHASELIELAVQSGQSGIYSFTGVSQT